MKLNIDFGFMGLLTLIFVILKCFGIIEWSWAWVFAPLWIETIIFCVMLIIFWWSE